MSSSPAGYQNGSSSANGHAHDAQNVAAGGPPATPTGEPPVATDAAETLSNSTASLNLTPEAALALWHQAAEQLGGLAAEKARQANAAAIVAPDQLVVTFPKKYNFCKQFCERPETMRQLVDTLSQLAGQPLRLTLQLADDGPAEHVEPVRPTSTRQRMYEVCRQPFVRRTMELFDATAERLEEAGARGELRR